MNDALEPGDSQPAPSGQFRAIIAVRDTGQTDVGGAEQIRALAEAVAARHHLTIIRILTLTPAFVAVVDSSRLDTLRRDPNVRYVEPDRLVRNRENPR